MLACLLFAGACGPQDNEPGTDVPEDESVLPTDVLPDSFARPLGPWKGDLDGMVERSVVRVFVPYGGYQFYYVRGRPRGAMVELMQRFERFLNDKVGRRHIRVNVFLMPVSRDRVLTGLTEGVADLAVGDLTVTADREERYAFTRPLLRDINEVVITGPSSPPLETLEDLSGKEVYVRRSSSYFEHLEQLSSALVEKGLAPIDIEPADELLEAEDILEMLAAGSISLTVFDDYKARFWADVFPKITVRDDLIVNEGGSIAWAHRPDSPELAAVLDEFLEEYGRGTLVGNDTFNRYLADAGSIRCQSSLSSLDKYADIIAAFKRYGERYDFDWLMLAAQGYQES
ncbi:MAG: lytic transglycosylase F [Woeseiaceae bacterium]